jgi:putative aldouronate transport system substrate-binding protein
MMIKDYETNDLTIGVEKLTNVHINWEIVPAAEKATKFNLAIASQNYADIYLGTTFTPVQVMMLSSGGMFRPLDDLIAEYGYNTRAAFENEPVVKEAISAPDGHIYTLFYTDLGVHMESQQKCFVLPDWLDALNIDMPQTTEGFKSMLIQFRDQDANGNGDPSDEIPLVGFSNDPNQYGDPIYYLISPFQ